MTLRLGTARFVMLTTRASWRVCARTCARRSLCDAYNAAVTESAQLKEQIVSLESKKQFKGMTVSEQAIMFDEKVHLISRHDELQVTGIRPSTCLSASPRALCVVCVPLYPNNTVCALE